MRPLRCQFRIAAGHQMPLAACARRFRQFIRVHNDRARWILSIAYLAGARVRTATAITHHKLSNKVQKPIIRGQAGLIENANHTRRANETSFETYLSTSITLYNASKSKQNLFTSTNFSNGLRE